MKTIFKNQNNFIETLDMCGQDVWNEKFNYLISLNDLLPATCPDELLPYRVATCQSRTYFRAWTEGSWLRVAGWSNTPVQRGIIVSMIEMFDRTPSIELQALNDIYFHTKSGLIDNLTPLRKEGLKTMVERITDNIRGCPKGEQGMPGLSTSLAQDLLKEINDTLTD